MTSWLMTWYLTDIPYNDKAALHGQENYPRIIRIQG